MSINASVGLSTEKNPVLAAEEAAKRASIKMYDEKPCLAIAFSSVDLAYPILLKTLSASLNHIPIIGASGAAIFSNQGLFKHGLAVMLLSLPNEVYFNTACVRDIKTKGPLNAGKELGEKLLSGFKGSPRVLSIIFSDGLMDEGSSLINGLQEILGTSSPLVGASASDNLRFLKTFIYCNHELLSDASTGILLGGRLSFGLGTKHGWKPLGKPHTVTRSKGDIIYEIDNQPAVKIYEGYLAKNISELKKELKRISVLYPIGVHLAGEKEHLLRNIFSIEHDGSLKLRGNVNEGSSIRLMIGTKESCLDATQEAVNEAKKGLSSQPIDQYKGAKNNFALIFDSVSRYMLLRRDANKELQIIKDGLGENTPMIGLYTYGEQAPLTAISYHGQAYFHNQTISVLTIGG